MAIWRYYPCYVRNSLSCLFLPIQWYRVPMEVDAAQQQVWKPVKCEVSNPSVNWDRSWEFARLNGLSSDQTSFLFRILHNILPTNSRLHRLKQKDSPACTLCSSGNNEDCLHALLARSYNSNVKNWVLDLSRKVVPNCKLEDIVTLHLDLSKPMMFPLIWLLSHVFSLVWQLRVNKKSIVLYNIRAEIEAKINLLRKSSLNEAAGHIENLINL